MVGVWHARVRSLILVLSISSPPRLSGSVTVYSRLLGTDGFGARIFVATNRQPIWHR